MKRGSLVRQSVAASAVLILLLFLMPLAAAEPSRAELFSGEVPMDETEGTPFVSGEKDGAVTLRVLRGDAVRTMDLGTYLLGVVRAEMPASFEPEALKAQTVAARTYTLYKMKRGGNHGDTADLCTDPGCCQAYLEEEQARQNWGLRADAYEEKIEDAVQSTDGQVILYGGEPILAVFHSSSAGRTRAAGEVWVKDLPYLQAVDSPEQGERIPDYYSRVEIPLEEFRKQVQARWPEAELSGEAEHWLAQAVTDDAGSVETLHVGGVRVDGTELRSALGLRSACFTWEVQGERLVFFVTGYGHGVGLSQYGANRMAESGAAWQEILTHYYTGVTVGPYTAADLYNPGGTVVK